MIKVETLKSIATQLMTRPSVSVDGKSIPIRPSSRQHLRTAAFTVGGHEYQAIAQNPEKPSRWEQLARSGHQVVQFKDAERNKFLAVVVDDEITYYGASKKRHEGRLRIQALLESGLLSQCRCLHATEPVATCGLASLSTVSCVVVPGATSRRTRPSFQSRPCPFA